ncbi:MAG: hypothetical protein WCL32_25860, partial [Planctomycetota bacterium]
MFHIVESWDWSGAGRASRRQPGLARASWSSTSRSYGLTHGFSRNDVIKFMQQHATAVEKGTLALVSFDFPFSFPYLAKGNQFIDGGTNWNVFGSTVHAALQPDGAARRVYGSPADYGQGGFPDHFSHLFMGAGNIGPNYLEVYRATENFARQQGLPAASVFRLVLPMVGVQSLGGIYVLQALLKWCIKQRFPLTIWPLGRLDRSGVWHEGTVDWNDHGLVIVESYPRISFHR